ncbi:MAG: hypothetical protein OXR72_13875 [Gemmatimonadota bacterium]|nr:hypothetical protein [Gemmatimonadota bacterium]
MRVLIGSTLVVVCFSAVVSAQVPPEVLTDMYLMEAKTALEDTTIRPWYKGVQKAWFAFARIESLNVDPPLEFCFLYGKFLVGYWRRFSSAS